MGVSQMAIDSMAFVKEIAPILFLLGAISFADLTIQFLIKLFKSMKAGKIKW